MDAAGTLKRKREELDALNKEHEKRCERVKAEIKELEIIDLHDKLRARASRKFMVMSYDLANIAEEEEWEIQAPDEPCVPSDLCNCPECPYKGHADLKKGVVFFLFGPFIFCGECYHERLDDSLRAWSKPSRPVEFDPDWTKDSDGLDTLYELLHSRLDTRSKHPTYDPLDLECLKRTVGAFIDRCGPLPENPGDATAKRNWMDELAGLNLGVVKFHGDSDDDDSECD